MLALGLATRLGTRLATRLGPRMAVAGFRRHSPTPCGSQEGSISGRTRLLHLPDEQTSFSNGRGNSFHQLKQAAEYSGCTVVSRSRRTRSREDRPLANLTIRCPSCKDVYSMFFDVAFEIPLQSEDDLCCLMRPSVARVAAHSCPRNGMCGCVLQSRHIYRPRRCYSRRCHLQEKNGPRLHLLEQGLHLRRCNRRRRCHPGGRRLLCHTRRG